MTRNNKTPLVIHLSLLITMIFWASAFVAIRIGLTEYSPGALALLRHLVASIVIALLLFRKQTRLDLSLPVMLKSALLGIMGISIYNLALNTAEVSVSASIASFIIAQAPVVITLLAIVFLKERLSRLGWFGLLLSVFGVSLIAYAEINDVSIGYGILYLLLALSVGAIYCIGQKPILNQTTVFSFLAYAIWGATLSLLMYLPDLFHAISNVSLSVNLAGIYLGIFPTVLSYGLWSYAFKQMNATKAASYLYLIPLFSTFLGWICLGEQPLALSLIGGCVALIGAIIVQKGDVKLPEKTTVQEIKSTI